jgi:hypothetical protein
VRSRKQLREKPSGSLQRKNSNSNTINTSFLQREANTILKKEHMQREHTVNDSNDSQTAAPDIIMDSHSVEDGAEAALIEEADLEASEREGALVNWVIDKGGRTCKLGNR